MWAHVGFGPLMVNAPPDTTTTEPPPSWTVSSMIIVPWRLGMVKHIGTMYPLQTTTNHIRSKKDHYIIVYVWLVGR